MGAANQEHELDFISQENLWDIGHKAQDNYGYALQNEPIQNSNSKVSHQGNEIQNLSISVPDNYRTIE